MIYIYRELLDGVQKATLNHLRMDSIRTLTEPEVTNRPLERVKGSSMFIEFMGFQSMEHNSVMHSADISLRHPTQLPHGPWLPHHAPSETPDRPVDSE